VPSGLSFHVLRFFVDRDIRIYPCSQHDLRPLSSADSSGQSLVHGLSGGRRGVATASQFSIPFYRLGGDVPTESFYSVLCADLYTFFWPDPPHIQSPEFASPAIASFPYATTQFVRIPVVGVPAQPSAPTTTEASEQDSDSDINSVSPLDEEHISPDAAASSDTASGAASSKQPDDEQEQEGVALDPDDPQEDRPTSTDTSPISVGEYLRHFRIGSASDGVTWPVIPENSAYHLGYTGRERLCLRLTSVRQLSRLRSRLQLTNTADVDSIVAISSTSLINTPAWLGHSSETQLNVQCLWGEFIKPTSVGAPVRLFGNECRQIGQYSNFKAATILSSFGALSLFIVDNQLNTPSNRRTLRDSFYSQLRSALKRSSWLTPPLSSLLSVFELGMTRSTGRDTSPVSTRDFMKVSSCCCSW